MELLLLLYTKACRAFNPQDMLSAEQLRELQQAFDNCFTKERDEIPDVILLRLRQMRYGRRSFLWRVLWINPEGYHYGPYYMWRNHGTVVIEDAEIHRQPDWFTDRWRTRGWYANHMYNRLECTQDDPRNRYRLSSHKFLLNPMEIVQRFEQATNLGDAPLEAVFHVDEELPVEIIDDEER